METEVAITLLERQRIVDVLCRYASALDAEDYAAVRAVFADDVEATYGNRDAMHGADNVVEWIAGYGRSQAWQHHLVSVYHVELEGDAAAALTYVTATQAPTTDPRHVSTTHGVYDDELRRIDGEWKITRRRMEVMRRRVSSDD